ncbi:MAG TPA: 4Fe-4S binding protein, partial [Synergistaceae bacterium]|nr:4Fe-4S binding protein [Synergistaceae bacterium]
GRALPHLVPHADLSREARGVASCQQERCLRCGACAVSCRDSGYQAISWAPGETPRVDQEACDGCGLCVGICPVGCLELKARG